MEFTEAKDLLPTRRDIAARIFRQRSVFAVVFLLVVAGFLLTGQFRPKYKAEMKILVRKERVDPVVTTSTASTPELQSVSVSEQDLNSEVQILRGEDLLRNVVVQAGLAPKSGDPVAIARAVQKLEKNLDVTSIEKTNLIGVTYQSPTPEQSERVLTVMELLYPATQRSFDGNGFQVAFFEKQVTDQRRALDAAQSKMVDFTNRTGVIAADMEREIAIHQMGDLKLAQIQTDAEIANLRGNVSTLESQVGNEPTRILTESRTGDNPQLRQQLETTLLGLKLKQTDLLNKYDPSYRLVQDVKREIQTTQDLIDSEEKVPVRESTTSINPLRQTLMTQFDETSAQLAGLQQKRDALRSSYANLQHTAARLTTSGPEQVALLQDVTAAQDQLKLYVDKLAEAKVTRSLDASNILNVVVAQHPIAPTLPQNSKLGTLAAMLFAGLVLSFGAAFLFDIFDPTVHNASELGDALEVPVLAEFGRDLSYERG